MEKRRWVAALRPLCSVSFVLLCSAFVPSAATAQPSFLTAIPQTKFNSGQDIVPYFEGWIRNPDGTFDLVFGYFNRNWKQELAIPAGPDNKVEPGGPDAGQPAYFLPRRQRWIYRLRVPADFGNKEAIWTITANGRTETAYGNLLAAQEINDRVVSSNGNLDPDWLRIGMDIVGGDPAPTFNMAFEVDGEALAAVPEPGALLLVGTGLGLVARRVRRKTT